MSDKAQYTFSYIGQGGSGVEFPSTKSLEYSVDFDDTVQWIYVADEFFNFLSSIYGYRCDPQKYAAQFGPEITSPWDDE